MMRVPLRETGSIVLQAPRDEVSDLLERQLGREPGFRRSAQRIEAGRGDEMQTFVLFDAPEGRTRVVHARTEKATFGNLNRPREELREAVEAELFRLQRMLEMQPR